MSFAFFIIKNSCYISVTFAMHNVNFSLLYSAYDKFEEE